MGNTKDSITDEVRDEKKVEAMEDEMKFEDGGSRGDEEEDGEVTSEEGAIKKTGEEQVKTFKAPGQPWAVGNYAALQQEGDGDGGDGEGVAVAGGDQRRL